MNKQQVVDFLYEIKKKLEQEGYIPTIELVIDDLETKIAEERIAEEEKVEAEFDEDGDFTGASDDIDGSGR